MTKFHHSESTWLSLVDFVLVSNQLFLQNEYCSKGTGYSFCHRYSTCPLVHYLIFFKKKLSKNQICLQKNFQQLFSSLINLNCLTHGISNINYCKIILWTTQKTVLISHFESIRIYTTFLSTVFLEIQTSVENENGGISFIGFFSIVKRYFLKDTFLLQVRDDDGGLEPSHYQDDGNFNKRIPIQFGICCI